MTLCEKIKGIGKKAIIYASTISLLSLGGCVHLNVTLKTIQKEEIRNVKIITDYSEKIEQNVDYSKMTWQEAIAYVKTPNQVQDYLIRHFEIDLDELMLGFNLFGINFFTKGETFKYNHTRKKGICIDYATAAAALLSDDGYPPLLLYLKCEDSMYQHVVFLYKTTEGFGALGITPRNSIYNTLDDLVTSLGEEYKYFSVVNLDENFKNREWIDGDIDLQGYKKDKWTKVKNQKNQDGICL